MEDARERKLAENEALAREVNDRVEQLAARWNAPGADVELICECSSDVCTDRVHVTLEDYNEVRSNPLRFIVAPGHLVAEIEEPVGEAGDAVVVEKTGAGRDVAEETA